MLNWALSADRNGLLQRTAKWMQGTLKRLLVNPDICQTIRIIKLSVNQGEKKGKALFAFLETWCTTLCRVLNFIQQGSP